MDEAHSHRQLKQSRFGPKQVVVAAGEGVASVPASVPALASAEASATPLVAVWVMASAADPLLAAVLSSAPASVEPTAASTALASPQLPVAHSRFWNSAPPGLHVLFDHRDHYSVHSHAREQHSRLPHGVTRPSQEPHRLRLHLLAS